MNNEAGEKTIEQTSAREKDAAELVRALSDIAHRKERLIVAIRVPSRSIAIELSKRLVTRIEEGAMVATKLSDEGLATTLNAMKTQISDLPISETLLVPQGVELLPKEQLEEFKTKAFQDRAELAKLVEGIFISLPTTYEPKPLTETLVPASQPLEEPESSVPHVEIGATETPAAIVVEKSQTQPHAPVAPVQTIEKPPEDLEPKGATQTSAGASSQPAGNPPSDKSGAGDLDEEDNLPAEARKFTDVNQEASIDNGSSVPPKKETQKQKKDRLVRELRHQVLAEKKAEEVAKRSGGGTGKPPAKPSTTTGGDTGEAENEPNPDRLELDGTETSDGLMRKIAALKKVSFAGQESEGTVVAEVIRRNLVYMGTEEFRALNIIEKKGVVGAFIDDLKTIDPKVAELPFVKELEAAITPGTPAGAKEPEVPVKMIASPSEAVVKAVLEDPAGFDVGKALDVLGFDEFLIEAQKMGVVIDMADSASLKKRFEAFAFKDAAAIGTYELYADSISKDLGLSLDEEGKQAVREHLERQAHVNPESIKGLVDKLRISKELPKQVAGFEKKLEELKAELTPEAQAQAMAEFTTKREAFEMVLKTNQFLPGYSKEGGIAGLGRLQHLFGLFSKKSYKGSVARSELSRISGSRSKGFEKYTTLGTGFSNEELRTGLQLIELKLADFEREMEAKSLGVAELEEQGRLMKEAIEDAKVNLFQDSALTKKLVGMARVKIKDKMNSGLLSGEETVEKAVSANELFERTIRASSGNKFGDDGDYFEGVDVPVYRKWIDEALDRGIEKEIQKAIVRSMALSTGRFGELQRTFDKMTGGERLGSKSRAEVRKFIVKKLKIELDAAAKLKVDESTEDGKKQVTEARLKALHLNGLIVKQQEALALNK